MTGRTPRSGLPRHSPHLTTSLQRQTNKPGTLRLFYAIKIPGHIRERLMRLQGELGRDWRPVAPHQMHMTLAFMGEVPEADLARVIAAGEYARLLVSHPFTVKLGETGAFPTTRDPRVWFVEAQAPELLELAASLQRELQSWCDPKPFRPHLTLARRRAECARFVPADVSREWLVTEFELIRSELRSAGPEYQTLQCFDLTGSGNTT